MSFMMYDLILLGIFIIAVASFLIRKKENLKREGLLFLYKASWGIKLIDYVGNKYKKTMKILSYVSVVLGYVLMVTMIYLFYTVIKLYLFRPDVVSAIRVPPIMPLIPYIDKFVTFLPPFYFTFWIVILAVIAISHEFAHGIFAAYEKVKIKKTGFGFFPFFLPIFLAAFVEIDEKKMKTKSKFSQMSILSAGTFANVVTFIVFLAIAWAFFSLSFAPAGINFDSYSYSAVKISSITAMNDKILENPAYETILNSANEKEFNKIKAGSKNYLITKDFLEQQKDNNDYIFLYDDSPAVNVGLRGAIMEVDGVKIDSIEKLGYEVIKKSPGERVAIKTNENGAVSEYTIVLEKNPANSSLPWIGIGFFQQKQTGFTEKILNFISGFKKSNVYYEPKFGAALFLYNLLWWLVLISISVAFVNMLPVGIFDGGRFFYLTILALTRSEKKAEKAFKLVTYLFLFFVFVLIGSWVFSLFK